MNNVLSILLPAGIIGVMGLAFGMIIAFTGKIFAVKQDPLKDKIREVLPGANCGGCGFAGCDAYAQAVADGTADHVIRLPEISSDLAFLPAVTVLQLLAYHAAAARGCDIDKPRNLAKSVTVE